MSTRDQLREHLAAIEHERWGDWQRWMHGLCVKRANGDLIIPRDCVERWNRQINTPYAELSEKEKQSDRDQVDRYWPIIEPLLAAPSAPGEVTLTPDEAAWIRTWLEPLAQWSSPMAKQIAAKMDAAAAPKSK